MATETKQVKFKLVTLDELCGDIVHIVDDNTYKLARAKSPSVKRQLQRTQDLLCSISFHLQELQKITSKSESSQELIAAAELFLKHSLKILPQAETAHFEEAHEVYTKIDEALKKIKND